jgi:hypothetical protein
MARPKKSHVELEPTEEVVQLAEQLEVVLSTESTVSETPAPVAAEVEIKKEDTKKKKKLILF